MAADAHLDPDEAGGDGPLAEDRDYSLRAVDRVCAILDLLQQSVDGISLNTVVEATGMPKSSAYRYLWTLEAHRYVERDEETGLCRLGLGFLGMQSRHLELLREVARPWLEKLRDEFGETSNLGVLDSDRIIYVDIIESRRGVRLAAARGDRDPLHSTALGKAIAAHLSEKRVRDILARSGMPRRSASTITTIEDYLGPVFKALSQVPVLGFVPLAMMVFGIGEALKVVIIAQASLVPVAIATLKGIRSVPRAYVDVARAFRFSYPQLLRRVMLPAAVPSIFVGIRNGLTQAWLSLVTVELLASSEGLGFLIVWGRQLFQLDLVIAAILVVGVVGLVLDKGLAAIEARLLRWRPETSNLLSGKQS